MITSRYFLDLLLSVVTLVEIAIISVLFFMSSEITVGSLVGVIDCLPFIRSSF